VTYLRQRLLKVIMDAKMMDKGSTCENQWGKVHYQPIDKARSMRGCQDENLKSPHLEFILLIYSVQNRVKYTYEPVESSSPLGWPDGGGQQGLAAVSFLHSLS
jgi:hypothetical protein